MRKKGCYVSYCEIIAARMSTSTPLTNDDFVRLAKFRYALRQFLHFSEEAAAGEKLTGQQHQALLAIRGNATGETNVTYLAEHLCLKHHTTVELVQRLEKAGLLTKHPSSDDRRAVLLELTTEGESRLDRLTLSHRTELARLGPEIFKRLSSFYPI
jgi:DNA-binding MarR family transcriptional regulator